MGDGTGRNIERSKVTGRVFTVAWNPKGDTLLFGMDGNVILWDTISGKRLAHIR